MYSWFWFGIFFTKIDFTVSDYVSVAVNLANVEINCQINHFINITAIDVENPKSCDTKLLSKCELNIREFNKIKAECNKKVTCKYQFSAQHNDCGKQMDTRFQLSYLCSSMIRNSNCYKIKGEKDIECPEKQKITVTNATVFLDQGHCSNCNCTQLEKDILIAAGNKCDGHDECDLYLQDYEKHPCAKSPVYFAVYFTCLQTEHHLKTKTSNTYAAVFGCMFAVLGLAIAVLVAYRYRKNGSLSQLFMHKSLDNTSDISPTLSRRNDIDIQFRKPDKNQETTLTACSEQKPEISKKTDYFVMDPKETGYNRTCYSPNKINNTLTQKISFRASIIDQETDPYTETTDYDHTHCNRHNENANIGNNIYSRATDDTYDTAKHTKEDGLNNSDDYDHVFVTNWKNN